MAGVSDEGGLDICVFTGGFDRLGLGLFTLGPFTAGVPLVSFPLGAGGWPGAPAWAFIACAFILKVGDGFTIILGCPEGTFCAATGGGVLGLTLGGTTGAVLSGASCVVVVLP